MHESGDFEQFTHGSAIMADQARKFLVDVGDTRGLGFERSRALFDAKPP